MRIIFLVVLAVAAQAADVPPGQRLYDANCAVCHDGATAARVPARAVIQRLPAAAILKSLESGVMRAQAAKLTAEERKQIAEFLGAREAGATPKSARCSSDRWDPEGAPSWNGWGAGPENARFAAAAGNGLTASNVARLKLKWAFALGSVTSVRSQAAVFGGRVFIGASTGSVWAIDAATGCVYWEFAAGTAIGSSTTIGSGNGRSMVFFGDRAGRLYAIDARTGEKVWDRRLDEHPYVFITATPQVHDGVVYAPVSSYEEILPGGAQYLCCTFRGSVSALDAATGRVLWKTYTIPEPAKPQRATQGGSPQMGPSGAGVWSSPTLDPAHGLLYAATGDNYSDPPTDTSDAIMALELKTGRIVWSRQLTAGDAFNTGCTGDKKRCPNSEGQDHDFGSPPILVNLPRGRRALVAGQKSGMLYALDPDERGKVLWQARLGQGSALGGIQWGIAAEGDRVYSPLSDIAFLGRGKLDPKKGGGLFAYQIGTGERLWHTPAPACGDRPQCSPAQSGSASAIPGAVFSGSVDGHLRAYDGLTGRILWDFDTAREYESVNGLPARGGAIDGPGPTIAGGIVYATSGYAQWGGLPGNVLLAFSVDGH